MPTTSDYLESLQSDLDRITTALDLEEGTKFTDIAQMTEGGEISKGLYITSTIQERDAIENPEDGNICLVYSNIKEPLSNPPKAGNYIFPDTVTFDTAIGEEDEKFIVFSTFDEDILANFILFSDSCLIRIDEDEDSYEINYTSEDGITYTKTDGIDSYTLPSRTWNVDTFDTECSQFMILETDNISVTGTYKYENNQWGNLETLEIYDYLDLFETITDIYETNYIPNQATETVVEFSNFNPYDLTKTSNFLGIRYGTRSTFKSSTTWSNSYGVSSWNYGNFKFGNQEKKCGSSSSILDNSNKTKFKFNSTGVYEYDYENETWNEFKLFDSPATMTTMTDPFVLFGNKEVITLQDTQKTIYSYSNAVPLNIRFYTLEVYENNVLKAKYVPAKLGNNVGIYDTVAQEMLKRVTGATIGNDENN